MTLEKITENTLWLDAGELYPGRPTYTPGWKSTVPYYGYSLGIISLILLIT